MYGPQKGASPEMIEILDHNLAHFAAIVERDLRVSIKDLPGSGAAGGLGGGLVAFADGKLEPGVDLIIEAVDLKRRLAGADLCLTGEGAIDDQSAFGKTAVGVSRLARSIGCPTLALTGTIKPGAEAVLAEGIDAYFSICDRPISLDEAKTQASLLLERATEQAVLRFSGRPTTHPFSLIDTEFTHRFLRSREWENCHHGRFRAATDESQERRDDVLQPRRVHPSDTRRAQRANPQSGSDRIAGPWRHGSGL